MKSERRHDLAENSLAKWLGSRLEQTAPYQSSIYWVIVVVLVVICVSMLWNRYSTSSQSKAWSEYVSALNAQDETQFQALIDNYPSGPIGVRARVSAGEMLLSNACDLVFTDREQALPKLEKALGYFLSAERLLFSPTGELAQQVAYDLAQTYEMLSYLRTGQGDGEKAIEYYEKNAELWPGSVFYLEASKRLELLRSPSGKRFTDYFATIREIPGAATSPVDFQVDPSLPATPSQMSIESQLNLDDTPVTPVE